jgi:hypothetical protein
MNIFGKHIDTGYYFNTVKDGITTLDHTFINYETKVEQYVIYADCLLTKNT